MPGWANRAKGVASGLAGEGGRGYRKVWAGTTGLHWGQLRRALGMMAVLRVRGANAMKAVVKWVDNKGDSRTDEATIA